MFVLLSGEIASGKSTIAQLLVDKFSYQRIRTGQFLMNISKERNIQTNREGLQTIGDQLDVETSGEWVVDLAKEQIASDRSITHWVLDSVRRDFQAVQFREHFTDQVLHAHLYSPAKILKKRFELRASGDDRDVLTNYENAKSNATEQHSRVLREEADVCFNSHSFGGFMIAATINSILNNPKRLEK